MGHIDPKEIVKVAGVQNGVAVIVMNSPPVNSLGPQMMEGLNKCWEQCNANPEVKAMVLTGTKNFFMAGADIPNLLKMVKTGDKAQITHFLKAGMEVFNKFENGPKPMVAAVNGDAFGGGCELTMICHARVALAKAKFGLPELNLGLIPALGGTQRLPRLIGLQAAVNQTLSSKPMNATQAHKLGLVDMVVKNPQELIMAAGKVALDIVSGKIPRKISLSVSNKLPPKEEGEVIIATARVAANKKNKNVPHPLKYLDAVEHGFKNGGAAGLDREVTNMCDLMLGNTSKALLHFFLASRATTKLPGLDLKKASKVKSVAILGGGTMGAGIAICMLMKGIPVLLKEINEQALEAGVKRILDDITRVVKARKMNPMFIEGMMRGLTPTTTYDGFDKVDLVIEAAVENVPLKQKIFAELEKVCKKTCILATNTSTINIDVVSAQTKAQDRILGLHFFSPAHIMPLLEIVKSDSTSEQVLATSVVLAKTIGKTPVVVGNCVGFAANRAFFPYGMSGSILLQGGLNPYEIDKALMDFGMPMGIFRMNDSVGVDIGVHIAKIFKSAYADRLYDSSLSQRMVDAKLFGIKSGQGFYRYVKNKPVPDLKKIEPILEAIRKEGKVPSTAKLSPKDIVEICIFPVINESARIVDEKFINSAADLDIVSIFGYGFPAYRGGLLHYGSSVGFDKIAQRLQYFADTLGKDDKNIQAFFAPSAAIKKLAQATRA